MTFKPVAREVFSVSQLIMMIHCIGKAKIRKKVNRNNYVCEYPKGTAKILSYQLSKAYSDRVLSNYKHIKPKG